MDNKSNLFKTIEFDEFNVVVCDDCDLLRTNAKGEEPKKKIEDMHNHIYYELFFVLDDQLTIITEKEKNTYRNKVIVIPPKIEHCTIGEDYCSYRMAVFDSGDNKDKLKSKIRGFDKQNISVFDINENIKFYFEKLIKTDFNSDSGMMKGQSLVRLVLLEIFERLGERDEGGGQILHNGRFSYLDKIDAYINSHYVGKSARITDLAKEMFLSEKQVSRIIKKEYGKSFPQLINDRRMLAASTLLKNSDCSISEIIMLLEFESENYFYRLFKSYYGVTPLKYRKNAKDRKKA